MLVDEHIRKCEDRRAAGAYNIMGTRTYFGVYKEFPVLGYSFVVEETYSQSFACAWFQGYISRKSWEVGN